MKYIRFNSIVPRVKFLIFRTINHIRQKNKINNYLLTESEAMAGNIKLRLERIDARLTRQEWKRTPVATCEALVNSMPKRIKAVLENNGGHTKYRHLGPNFDIFT